MAAFDPSRQKQVHPFHPTIKEFPGKCGSVKDDTNGLCFMPEDMHIKPAPTDEKGNVIAGEINPYIKIETEKILRTMAKDMNVAFDMSKQYGEWARMEGSTPHNRQISEQHRQVWVARYKALSVAYGALNEYLADRK